MAAFSGHTVGDSSPQLSTFFSMKNILFLDTETVGLPGDMNQPYTNHANWPECVSIAWIVADETGS